MAVDKTVLAIGVLLSGIGEVAHRAGRSGTVGELAAGIVERAFEDTGHRDPGWTDSLRASIASQLHCWGAGTKVADSESCDLAVSIAAFARKVALNGGNVEVSSVNATSGDVELRKIFNKLNGTDNDVTIPHDPYGEILGRLESGLTELAKRQPSVDTARSLIESELSCIPASTNLQGLTDVSLGDFLVAASCIAVCCNDYLADQDVGIGNVADAQKWLASDEALDSNMLLLFSCDMSGIQSFIYDISGSGALRQLRARSLYLELMLEVVADYVLDACGMNRVCLQYTGGGHAYLLFPNTRKTKEALEEASNSLREWFLEQFQTDLYLACAWTECSASSLMNRGADGSYPITYKRLSQKLSDAKSSRYTAAQIARLNALDDGTAGRECTECRRVDRKINEDGKCSLCAALGSMAHKAINNDFFVLADITRDGETRYGLPMPIGCELFFCDADGVMQIENKTRIYAKGRLGLDGVGALVNVPVVPILVADYCADMEREGISTYSGKSTTLDGDLGIERLGILRADVDNLGTAFTQGLPADRVCFSRMATLSRSLSRFFKYDVNELLNEKGYSAQVIYSGGDDLFIVGNWSDIIAVGMEIRSSLREYVGSDAITLSAGIGMFTSTYPIARMAQETGSLEDAAKLFKRDGDGRAKDAVALWSEEATYGWEEFEIEVAQRKDELAELFAGHERGKAFIYKMIELLRNFDDAISVPRLAYLLARSFENDKSDVPAQASQKIFEWSKDARQRAYMITALEWYVYSIRERG